MPSNQDETRSLLAESSPTSPVREIETQIAAESPSAPQPAIEVEPVHQRGLQWRWLVLFLNCLLLMGNYYAYDNPAALSVLLQRYLNLDNPGDYDVLFGSLYSVYSFPNMVLPFFSGYIMDKLGAGRVLLFLSACVCVGQAVFAAGVTGRAIGWMITGRILFGMGGESVSVAQSCITTRWFRNKELGFALGMNLAVPRIGSVLNAILSPLIATSWSSAHSVDHQNGTMSRWNETADGEPGYPEKDTFGVPAALWFGFFMCLLSFISALVLVLVVGTEPDDEETALSPNHNSRKSDGNSSRSTTQRHDSVGEDSAKSSPSSPGSPIKTSWWQDLLAFSRSTVQDFRELPSQFWFLCIIVMLIYGTIIPFNNIISEFLQSKWFPGQPQMAGRIMGIPDTICAFLVSICGYVVDRFGRRATSLIGCCASIAVIHFILAVSPVPVNGEPSTWFIPVLPLIALGLCYSVYGVAFWSSIACLFTEPISLPPSPVENRASDEQPLLANPPPSPDQSLASAPTIASRAPWFHPDLASSSPSLRVLGSFRNRRSLSKTASMMSIGKRTLQRVSSTNIPLLAAAGALQLPRTQTLDPASLRNLRGLNLVLPNDPMFSSQTLPRRTAPRYHPSYYRTGRSLHRGSPLVNNDGMIVPASSMESVEQVRQRSRSRNQLRMSPTRGMSPTSSEAREDAPISPLSSEGSMDLSVHLALAYGISTSALNLSLTIVPLLVAALRQRTKSPPPDDQRPSNPDDFVSVQMFFVGEAVLACIISIIIWWRDRRYYGRILERPQFHPTDA